MRSLLANLGFLFQLAGFFIFIVAITSIFLGEHQGSISFFITSSLFFILGFPLNALCERKEMNFRESLVLFFLTFLFLGLIGSIPYIYIDLTNSTDLFNTSDINIIIVNSIFESTSGFTTLGMSFLDSATLSTSLKIYRAFSQFIGGVGIVYLLLTFLYTSNHKISRVFNKLLGFEINSEIKKNVIEILIIFSLATIILSLLMYYYNNDLIKSFTLIMSGISTGGFSHYDLKSLSLDEKVLIMISMVFGSISILVFSRLKKESILYIIFIFSVAFLIHSNLNVSWFDSLFHAISLISTTGYSYISFESFQSNVLFIFSIFMLIGGMAISTSGGIKIIRVINSLSYIVEVTKNFIKEKSISVESEKVVSLAYLFFFVLIWVISTLIFSFYVEKFDFSLFETASILSTSGFSVGVVSNNLPIEFKILLIFLMILARIEIIPFFAIFILSSKKENYEQRTGFEI